MENDLKQQLDLVVGRYCQHRWIRVLSVIWLVLAGVTVAYLALRGRLTLPISDRDLTLGLVGLALLSASPPAILPTAGYIIEQRPARL